MPVDVCVCVRERDFLIFFNDMRATPTELFSNLFPTLTPESSLTVLLKQTTPAKLQFFFTGSPVSECVCVCVQVFCVCLCACVRVCCEIVQITNVDWDWEAWQTRQEIVELVITPSVRR